MTVAKLPVVSSIKFINISRPPHDTKAIKYQDIITKKMRKTQIANKQPAKKRPPVNIASLPALNDQKDIELNEEWSNFMQRIGEVSNMVKDLASGDKDKAAKANVLADLYLNGKIINDEDVEMTVKSDRTVINKDAFRDMGGSGETQEKDAWMASVSKDAEQRFQDKKVRREKCDTLKTMAEKAYRKEDYEKALSCYNKAIDYIRDNPMLYCDRALTNIKLGNFEKVYKDCDLAIRLNEKSFKARLYIAKAYQELEEEEKLAESLKELEEMFPQHHTLVEYFLRKTEKDADSED